jgi:hypothetical protein
MSNIARVEQKQELAVATENTAMVSMFERMASDPNVDVDKLERLMQMRERAIERSAKTDFDAAMADMQPELPVIGERGKAAGRYTYALWEDINAQIKPVLQKHGFALTFRTDFKDGISITGVLSHRAGHREETSITLPADGSGNKNDVQAVASSVSYGKRYTAGALLNLTSHGEDDDAYRAAVETISDDQEIQINDMLEATGSDKAKFLKWLKVEKVSDIPAKSFDSVMATLRAKESGK